MHRSSFCALVVVCVAGCARVEVFAVAPDTVAAGGVVDVDGNGFADDTALTLEGAAGTIALATVVNGGGSLSGTLPASTPAGVYDVVATNKDGVGRKDGALTVVAGQLEFFFIDVGQGDGTFVVFPDGSTMLIDGGPRDAGATVKRVIDDAASGRLDVIAFTHTDADHLGGVVHVLRGDDGDADTDDDVVPPTRWTGEDDGLCDSQLCDEFRRTRGAPFVIPDNGTVVDHGGATVTVVARDGVVDGGGPVGGGALDDNARSLALLFEFGGKSVYVGGDLTGGGLGTADVEAELVGRTGPVDVVHLNHHGSQTSTSPGFLEALQPRAVVVSVGNDNAFCHPETSVVDRLRASGVAVYATGDGIVDALDRCDATQWPANSQHGLGTFSLVVGADGSLTMAGDAL